MDNLSNDINEIIISYINDINKLGLLLMVKNSLKNILNIKIYKLYNTEIDIIKSLKNNVRNIVMDYFYLNLKNNTYNNDFNYLDRIYNAIAMMTWSNYLIYNNMITLTHNENEWCCNLLDNYKKNNLDLKNKYDHFSYYSYCFYFHPNKI